MFCYLLRSRAGGSCLRRKMSLFGVLMSISAGKIQEATQRIFIFHSLLPITPPPLLPYFLFECGPYFFAAREALSMM